MNAVPRQRDTEIDGHGSTRERLLDAAIALFAERGLHGASMREINQASGAKNGSAVQYHFGERYGVIEAVVERVTNPIVASIQANLDRVAAVPGNATESVRSVVEAAFGTALEAMKSERAVKAARVMAMVVEDRDTRINQLLTAKLEPVVSRMEHLLAAAMPAKSRALVRLELNFTLVGLLHLVSDLHVLFGLHDVVTDAEIRNRVNRFFLDFVARGLSTLPTQGAQGATT